VRTLPVVTAVLLSALFVGHAPAAMVIDGYAPERHDRFYSGTDPAKDFIGAQFEWSGVGRTSGTTGTMISPHYFLSAAHNNFHPGAGETVRFYLTNDPNGPFEDYVVESGQAIDNSDLWLGRLTTPVSANIAQYPVLALANNSDYDNRLIFNYGRSNTSPNETSVRVGLNNINPGSIGPEMDDGTTSQAYRFDFDPDNGQGADETFLQDGDSSGPSFAIVNGQLALVGIHWFIDEEVTPNDSGDTFVPFYVDSLNAAMVGESVTTVPEPASFALAISALLGAAAYSWRRRRVARRS